MISPLMYIILAFVPAGILSLVFEIWSRLQSRGSHAPGGDKLLRPPGETCRRKMEELDDQIGELSIWLIGFPATLLVCYLSNSGTATGTHPLLWILALAVAALVLGGLAWKLIRLLKQRDHWRLGFSGERAVGEQLSQLMGEDCRVFHDFPLDGADNIDHIVVASTGVFAVETCVLRKGAASDAQQAHEVVYDGKTLEFPFHTDARLLTQTRDHAARLNAWLNPRLNGPIIIQPILALPGWDIISRALGDVIVLNPKVIDTAIHSPSGETLSHERIKEISRLLDERCRDVEF